MTGKRSAAEGNPDSKYHGHLNVVLPFLIMMFRIGTDILSYHANRAEPA
jgi:hypothetical protein